MLPLRYFQPLLAVSVLSALLLLSACGGGSPSTSASSNTASAIDNIPLVKPQAASSADISGGVILTRLDAVLDIDISTEEIDAALAAIDGRIVTSRPGSPFVTIEVPRQNSAADLQTLADQLTAMDGIIVASIGEEIQTRLLPDFGGTTPPVTEAFVDHLAEARFPAAWNAKGLLKDCANDPVTLIIVDKFGSLASLGNLGSTIAEEFPDYTLTGTVLDNGETHGWEVAAMAAAAFAPSQHTGAMPFTGCLDLNLFSVSALTTSQHLEAIELALRVLGPTAIVNYSLGFVDRCETGCSEQSLIDGSGLSEFIRITPSHTRAWMTLKWKSLTRDLWDSFLVTAASGDEAGLETSSLYPALAMAPFSNVMNYAQLVDYLYPLQQKQYWGDVNTPGYLYVGTDNFMMDLLIDADTRLDPNSTSPATNVMMVGNGDLNTAFSSDSIIHVLANADQRINLSGTLLQDGSSLAAPQVAGLAAYLWALQPELRSRPMSDTINVIQQNARELPHGRFIDAYATVLSLDKDTASEPPDAPIREAILDVNDDGYFNQDDLVIFANIFQLPNAASPDAGTQSGEVYSRYDLNGSGTIDPLAGSGGSTERFDLDPENSTYLGMAKYSTVTLDFGNGTVARYDENSLSDVQILCYYAYSTLYLGDELTRSNLLPASECGGQNRPPKIFNVGSIQIDAYPFKAKVILAFDLAGNTPVQLTPDNMDVVGFDMKQVQGKLAFIAVTHSPTPGLPPQPVKLYTVNSDGSNMQQVPLPSNISNMSLPIISPDGTKIAFQALLLDAGDNQEIFVVNTDGSGLINISNHASYDGYGYGSVWSPDSSQVYFDSLRVPVDSPGYQGRVYVAKADGSDTPVLFPHFVNVDPSAYPANASPYWSPDSSKYVFMEYDAISAKYAYYVINADGTGKVKLFDTEGAFSRLPEWSPDSSQLVFVNSPVAANLSDIYMINADGSQLRQLTNTPNLELLPRWAPDSKQITYTSSGTDLTVFFNLLDLETGNAAILWDNYTSFSPKWYAWGY